MEIRDERNVVRLDSRDGPIELAYRDWGRGEPLLLLHGFFGESSDFQHLPGLAEGARAIAPDLRGHGSSTNPSAQFRFFDAARDVLALLERLGLPRCRAVGLSGGALTLLRMSVLRPAVITSMVLVSAADGFPPEARAFMAEHASPAALAAALPEMRAHHPRGDAQIEALFAAARDFARGDDDARLSGADLAAIAARTLIVAGDRDPLYPIEISVRLFRSIPGAALWVMPGAAHTPVFGAASAEFVARARSFLR